MIIDIRRHQKIAKINQLSFDVIFFVDSLLIMSQIMITKQIDIDYIVILKTIKFTNFAFRNIVILKKNIELNKRQILKHRNSFTIFHCDHETKFENFRFQK